MRVQKKTEAKFSDKMGTFYKFVLWFLTILTIALTVEVVHMRIEMHKIDNVTFVNTNIMQRCGYIYSNILYEKFE